MIMKSNLNVHHVITKTKVFRRLGWLIAGGALVLILLIFFSSAVDPRCAPLLAHSDEVVVPLPPNCTQTSVRPTGEMTNNLERERNQRDLILKSWIICKPSNSPPEISLLLDQDPRWLPSYVPGTYQFRRTVVIFPYAQPVSEGSKVIGVVCLVPWRRYASQIAGQCDGKFAVWK